MIIRENTEDLYAGVEFEAGSEQAHTVIGLLNSLQARQIATEAGISIKPISAEATERIVRYAFEYAREHGRGPSTASRRRTS